MKCEHVFSALATGSLISRWRASRHAARCPRCAAMAEEVRTIREELSSAPELTAAQRSLWSIARSHEFHVRPFRPRFLAPALVAIAACILAFGIIAFRRVWRPSAPRAEPVIAQVRPPLEAPPVWKQMREGLDSASRELALLRRRADLLDARRDADAMWLRFARRE